MKILLLVMGVGLVLVALQGAKRGWLPNGPNGYKPGKGVFRDSQPGQFWFFFTLYLVLGVIVTIHALRLLLGGGAPA